MDNRLRHSMLEEEELTKMSSVRTLHALKGLLNKAVGLIDAEIEVCEGKQGPCPHTDYTEVTTMRGPSRGMCESCGETFTIKEEVEQHGRQPETMGKRNSG